MAGNPFLSLKQWMFSLAAQAWDVQDAGATSHFAILQEIEAADR